PNRCLSPEALMRLSIIWRKRKAPPSVMAPTGGGGALGCRRRRSDRHQRGVSGACQKQLTPDFKTIADSRKDNKLQSDIWYQPPLSAELAISPEFISKGGMDHWW